MCTLADVLLAEGIPSARKSEYRCAADPVDHGRSVEHDDIGMLPDGDRSSISQTEVFRGEATHLPDRGFQREEPDIAAVVAENPRKRSPESRMRLGPAGQAIVPLVDSGRRYTALPPATETSPRLERWRGTPSA